MRRLTARLLLIGTVGLVYAGCSSSGTGGIFGSGGGSVPVTLPTSSATAAPFTVKPLLLDDGSEVNPATPAPNGTPVPPFVYKEILTNGPESSETQSALNAPHDPLPAGAPASAPTNPPSGGAGDPGSHLVTFSGSGSQQIILQLQKTLPDLVYQHNSGVPGQEPGFFTYPYLIFHLAYAPAAGLPELVSVSAEITGTQANAGAFDIRVGCKGAPGIAPAFQFIVCPSPESKKTLPALNSSANTTGPNPIIPAASAAFDPVAAFAPHLALVLNYNTPTDTTTVGNELYIDYVYAAQQPPG